ALSHVLASIEKSDVKFDPTSENISALSRITSVSPHFATLIAANPHLVVELPDPEADFIEPDYAGELLWAVEAEQDFGPRLAVLRRTWSRFLLQIVVRDIFENMSIVESRRLQTDLAEASIAAAVRIVRDELSDKYG